MSPGLKLSDVSAEPAVGLEAPAAAASGVEAPAQPVGLRVFAARAARGAAAGAPRATLAARARTAGAAW
jgi:hypothetical protein